MRSPIWQRRMTTRSLRGRYSFSPRLTTKKYWSCLVVILRCTCKCWSTGVSNGTLNHFIHFKELTDITMDSQQRHWHKYALIDLPGNPPWRCQEGQHPPEQFYYQSFGLWGIKPSISNKDKITTFVHMTNRHLELECLMMCQHREEWCIQLWCRASRTPN